MSRSSTVIVSRKTIDKKDRKDPSDETHDEESPNAKLQKKICNRDPDKQS